MKLVDELAGFECRHGTKSRWKPREGPNSCQTVAVVVSNSLIVSIRPSPDIR